MCTLPGRNRPRPSRAARRSCFHIQQRAMYRTSSFGAMAPAAPRLLCGRAYETEDYTPAWNNLGNAYTEMGRFLPALRCYDQALSGGARVDPSLHFNRAAALAILGRAPEELSRLLRSSRRSPGGARSRTHPHPHPTV